MEDYKKNWTALHDKPWQYTKDAHDKVSDKNLIEEDYKEFKKRMCEQDPDVLQSLKEHEIRHKIKNKLNETVQ